MVRPIGLFPQLNCKRRHDVYNQTIRIGAIIMQSLATYS